MTPKSDILVPLYVYPAPGAWDPLHEAIKAHPTLTFTVVVNPFNGPGLEALPDQCYTAEVPRLAAYPNVRLLGYVHTVYTTRALELVLRDVGVYAGWAGTPGLGVQGIFVDETPYAYNDEAVRYLAELTAAVKGSQAFGENALVIHNPGSVPDKAYLRLADTTVVFEDAYYTFQVRHAAQMLDNLGDRSRFACVIHSVPKQLREKELAKVVREVREVAGLVFMTDLAEDYYASFSEGWARLVAGLAGINDVDDSGSTDGSFDPREHKPGKEGRHKGCLGGCVLQ